MQEAAPCFTTGERFKWHGFCDCMTACIDLNDDSVPRSPSDPGSGGFADIYEAMLLECKGAGYMDPLEMVTRIQQTFTAEVQDLEAGSTQEAQGECPTRWVWCSSMCMSCSECDLLEYEQFCRDRVEFWSSYYGACLFRGKVDYSICSKACTLDPDHAVYVVFAAVAFGLGVLLIAVALKARYDARQVQDKVVQLSDVYLQEQADAERERKAQQEAEERQAAMDKGEIPAEQLFDSLQDWVPTDLEPPVKNVAPKDGMYEVNDARNQINVWAPQHAPIVDDDNKPGKKDPPPVQLPENDAAAGVRQAIEAAGMKERQLKPGQSRSALFKPNLESPYLPFQRGLGGNYRTPGTCG